MILPPADVARFDQARADNTVRLANNVEIFREAIAEHGEDEALMAAMIALVKLPPAGVASMLAVAISQLARETR